MARLNGVISKLKGSVGNLTFRQSSGQTVVSEKITRTTNSKTTAQQKQRMKWTNIIRMYQILASYMRLAFGGTSNGRSDYNKFVSANLGMAPVYLSKAEANADACIVAPYMITQGIIKPVAVTGTGSNAVTGIRLGTLSIDDDTTVAEFSNAVVQNNNDFEYGDQITYFLLTQELNEVTGVPVAHVDTCSIVLSKTGGARLLFVVDARGFSEQNGCLAALVGNDFGDHGMAWVHSRRQNNKTIVSTQSLVCENSLLEQYQSDDSYQKAVESYGGVNEAYLTPGESVSSTGTSTLPTDSTATKRTLSLLASPADGGTVSGAGTFTEGSVAGISASPASGYVFSGWSDGSSDASRSVTLNSDLSLTAYFIKPASGDDSDYEP